MIVKRHVCKEARLPFLYTGRMSGTDTEARAGARRGGRADGGRLIGYARATGDNAAAAGEDRGVLESAGCSAVFADDREAGRPRLRECLAALRPGDILVVTDLGQLGRAQRDVISTVAQVRERGAGLSTGQKQLINFARALAHRPGILILDEATSSVDTETEFLVRAALERMVEGRTSVVIAHRLSTVQRADTILVMHRGQLREMGSHQELLAVRGIYWKLYQLQYKDQELGEPATGLTPSLAVGTD